MAGKIFLYGASGAEGLGLGVEWRLLLDSENWQAVGERAGLSVLGRLGPDDVFETQDLPLLLESKSSAVMEGVLYLGTGEGKVYVISGEGAISEVADLGEAVISLVNMKERLFALTETALYASDLEGWTPIAAFDEWLPYSLRSNGESLFMMVMTLAEDGSAPEGFGDSKTGLYLVRSNDGVSWTEQVSYTEYSNSTSFGLEVGFTSWTPQEQTWRWWDLATRCC